MLDDRRQKASLSATSFLWRNTRFARLDRMGLQWLLLQDLLANLLLLLDFVLNAYVLRLVFNRSIRDHAAVV